MRIPQIPQHIIEQMVCGYTSVRWLSATDLANEFEIYTLAGKPHAHLMSALVKRLMLNEKIKGKDWREFTVEHPTKTGVKVKQKRYGEDTYLAVRDVVMSFEVSSVNGVIKLGNRNYRYKRSQ